MYRCAIDICQDRLIIKSQLITSLELVLTMSIVAN